jgi:hypothetical protein
MLGQRLERKRSSPKSGTLKLGLLWLEQINSQRRNKRTYFIFSRN